MTTRCVCLFLKITIRRRMNIMHLRSTVIGFAIAASFVTVFPATSLRAQEESGRHGRKYKAPPETSHIEITVLKGGNDKPIPNAAIIFHPTKDGQDEGNLEIKSGPDGKGAIDVIPTGSLVGLQVIANGYSTHAEEVLVDTATREITVRMQRPKMQVSTYTDNSGKSSVRKDGVQEPVRPAGGAAPPKPISSSDPILPVSKPKETPDTDTKQSTPPQR